MKQLKNPEQPFEAAAFFFLMQITLKKTGRSRTQATVVFTDEAVKMKEEEVVRALGAKAKIAGFRPGKAPLDILRAHFSVEKVREETVQSLIPDAMRQIVEEHKVHPIVTPRVSLTVTSPLTVEILLVEEPAVSVDIRPLRKEAKGVKGKATTSDVNDGKEPQREHQLLDCIAKHTKIDLAPELVEDEVRRMVQEHVQRIAQFGMSLDQWLQQQGKKLAAFIEEMQPAAEKRLLIRYGVAFLIETWNIEVTDADVEKAIDDLLAPLKEEERKKLSKLYVSGSKAFEQFRYQKKVERVLEML